MSSQDLTAEMQRLLDGQEELQRKQVDTHNIALQITAYLRSELGYDTDAVGSVNRRLSEAHRMIQLHESLLRGERDELGLIGWVHLLRRTWWAALVALGTLTGFVVGSLFPGVGT
ncbi:MAG: hypothetical protein AAF711_19995 [Planctomycetota bacterium]